MAIEIYTYADPYKISQTEYWEKIRTYPHLCASRTLVRGLTDVIEDNEIQALYCPIDEVVKDRVFPAWGKDIGRKLDQYSEIGRIFTGWHEEGNLSDNHFESLMHNRNDMLEAVRLFIELNIRADSIHTEQLNTEQKIFVDLLGNLEKEELFQIPNMPTDDQLKACLLNQVEKEREDKEKMHGDTGTVTASYQREMQIVDQMKYYTEQWDKQHIVIHGIHQFTPLQLRFISKLDEAGKNIIFLYNYLDQPGFQDIYQSWENIYSLFHAEIHHESKITTYQPPSGLTLEGYAIACNLAQARQKDAGNDHDFFANYEKYKDIKIQTYDNVSEYADEISIEFGVAEEKVRNRLERNQNREDPVSQEIKKAQVLTQMRDTVYTANKDVDELLQIYYPEYAHNRHFLSYPVGQFFVALYSLWDMEKKQIQIDFDLIRNCIYSGLLSGYDANRLLKTLIAIEPMFSYIRTYDEFKERMADYRKAYSEFSCHKNDSVIASLNTLAIYNIDIQEIIDFENAIDEINDTAKKLFDETSEKDQIQLSAHFSRLKEFLEKNQMHLIYEEERDLVKILSEHLENSIERHSFDGKTGTLDDLRERMYLYLNQKEDTSVDWFVKNFEQIEGDILLSKKQQENGENKRYHFACVSDRDMNNTVDELLPWPLSEDFVQKAVSLNDHLLEIYYTSLDEHNNFMRYALFYGLYFCCCETKISFVKNYGEEKTDCYGMLRLIGLEEYYGGISPKSSDSDQSRKNSLSDAKEEVFNVTCNGQQRAAMYFCPYLYFLDYVVKPGPVLSSGFMIQQFFMNILVHQTTKSIEGKPKDGVNLSEEVKTARDLLEKYFPFMSESEKIDAQLQAQNYILNQVFNYIPKDNSGKGIDKNHVYYDEVHMQAKEIFGDVEFIYEEWEDQPAAHEYEEFNKCTRKERDKGLSNQKGNTYYSYSAHKALKAGEATQKKMDGAIKSYINGPCVNYERVGDWCKYCSDRNICLVSYGASEKE